MRISDAIISHIRNQGYALVVLVIKPANAHAVGGVMVNGILPSGIGMMVVPLDID